jgi:hypothetical protein
MRASFAREVLMRTRFRLPLSARSVSGGRRPFRDSIVLVLILALGALLLLPRAGPTSSGLEAEATEAPAVRSLLEPGQYLVLASWRCSFPRLERVNEVALELIEVPLTAMAEQGRVLGWGQLNGGFRDDYNYHTYYITPSVEDYRRALGSVLSHMNRERAEEMSEFYELCSSTRETRVMVVTARP